MDLIGRGIIAGFITTLVFSSFAEPLVAVARMSGAYATSRWMLHLLLGSLIWGAGLALVHDLLRGPSWLRGALFTLLSWMFVSMVVRPLGAGGFSPLECGFAPLSATMLLQIAYGAVLGGTYGLLAPEAGEDVEAHAVGREPNPDRMRAAGH